MDKSGASHSSPSAIAMTSGRLLGAPTWCLNPINLNPTTLRPQTSSEPSFTFNSVFHFPNCEFYVRPAVGEVIPTGRNTPSSLQLRRRESAAGQRWEPPHQADLLIEQVRKIDFQRPSCGTRRTHIRCLAKVTASSRRDLHSW